MAAIARNRALDELRRRKVEISDMSDEALQLPDPGMLASDVVVRSEENRRRLPARGSWVVRQAFVPRSP
jgi:DNA-directed RNA polymerase specialized sigma24 family protein